MEVSRAYKGRETVYIAIEGLDGSGGTTQLARLADTWGRRAPTREVVRTREPSDGPVGRLIRAQLAGGELGDGVFPFLFVADRSDHLDRVVLPALSRGAVVLSDRCLLSSLAYQAGVLPVARILALHEGLRLPDLVVMLDLAPEVSLARVEARGGVRDRFETLDVLRRVRDAYEAGIATLGASGVRVARVDAAGTPDQVARLVEEAVWPR
jgi:dTMP kinase